MVYLIFFFVLAVIISLYAANVSSFVSTVIRIRYMASDLVFVAAALGSFVVRA
jgi:hypothetical protein